MKIEKRSGPGSRYPTMKLCLECSAELEESDIHCRHCGEEQPHMPSVYAVWIIAVLFVLGAAKACLWG